MPKGQVMEQFPGSRKAIREQRKLSLRDVDERSAIIAEETGDDSCRISASWLNRLEREKHELTANKLLVLAHIYGVLPQQLFRSLYEISSKSAPATGETALLTSGPGKPPGPYRWAILGNHDRTLAPLFPVGSVVQVDIRRRKIDPAQRCTNEFQRPIYFLRSKGAYYCGWCESDALGKSLTLLPHPLSSASRLHWKDRKEVEVIGRVVAVLVGVDSTA